MQMNPVLSEMLETKTVRKGEDRIPLEANISMAEGELIMAAIREVRPRTAVEVGLAYGVSSLYALQAMAATGEDFRHTIIDPKQGTRFEGLGIRNIERAGYADRCEIIIDGSEYALPRLAKEGRRYQFAIIDGWHTFDHVLVDFFFINRMLDVGGIVVLDDANFDGIRRVIDLILTWPAYEWHSATKPRRWARSQIRRWGRTRRYPSMVALKKVAEDDRRWDWHADF